MARKDKQPFRFGLTQLVRLIVFSILFYNLINYFSKNTIKAGQLDFIDKAQSQTFITKNFQNLYNQIPEQTKQKITDLPNTSLVLGATQQFEGIKSYLFDLPNHLINNIKKEILKKISQSLLKEIDE